MRNCREDLKCCFPCILVVGFRLCRECWGQSKSRLLLYITFSDVCVFVKLMASNYKSTRTVQVSADYSALLYVERVDGRCFFRYVVYLPVSLPSSYLLVRPSLSPSCVLFILRRAVVFAPLTFSSPHRSSYATWQFPVYCNAWLNLDDAVKRTSSASSRSEPPLPLSSRSCTRRVSLAGTRSRAGQSQTGDGRLRRSVRVLVLYILFSLFRLARRCGLLFPHADDAQRSSTQKKIDSSAANADTNHGPRPWCSTLPRLATS